jgi:hypothetical protein
VKLRLAVASTVVAAALVAPAAANAATLVTSRTCYTEGQTFLAGGSGFTPNGPVDFFRDGSSIGATTAGPTGSFAISAKAPLIAPTRERAFTFRGQDRGNPANGATLNLRVTQLDVDVKPTGGKPNRKRKVTARGFLLGKKLYAHVRRGRRYRKTVRIAKLKSPCGTAKARKRIFSRHARPGTYTVQFDARRRYSKATRPFVRFKVVIFQTSHPPRAASARERWVRVG